MITLLDYATILQATPDPYLIITPKQEIVDVNDAFLKITMVRREDILGKTVFEAFPANPLNPSDLEVQRNFQHSIERVLKNKTPDAMEVLKYDIRRSPSEGGPYEEHYWKPLNIPIIVNDKVKYILHRVEDVTEMMRLQHNELEKDYRAHLLLESSKDYAIYMLDTQGYITTWNKGAERLKQYQAEEIIGKHFSIFYSQEAREHNHPAYELKMAKENGRYEEEGWRYRKDGSRFWANVIIVPTYNQKGVHTGFGKVARDLSEQRKNQILKDEFISTVSHELRTPLTSISGALSLLQSDVVMKAPEKIQHLLEIATSNCERLSRLINDILDIEKLESGRSNFKLQLYNLAKLVEESIHINQIYAQKHGIKLRVAKLLPGSLANIDVDRLMQALTNLISNAVKFSFPHKQVVLTMSRKGEKIRIAVTNEGVGISDEFRSKIFERFSQNDASTTRREGGTGLGLAISKAIVERLKGTLNFTSTPNQKTTFYIDLPLVECRPMMQSSSPTLQKKMDEAKRILICEDDLDQANYLKILLQGAGYPADITTTAKEAQRLLTEQSYYALLLDLILPDKSGIDVIKEIRNASRGENIPIIVISIIAQEGRELLKGNAISVIDWLEKPIDFTKLSKAFSLIQEKIKIPRPHILHIEDDLDIQMISQNLLCDKAEITAVRTIEEAKKMLATQNFDLAILDLVLPDGNGVELLPRIAKKGLPVVVFAGDEIDPKYASYVSQTLIKSKTTPEKLLETIHELIHV